MNIAFAGRSVKLVAAVALGLFLMPARSDAADRGAVELTPTFSYQWNGSMATYNGDVRFTDGVQYGAIIGYAITRETLFELSWMMNSSTATFETYYYPGAPPVGTIDLTGLDEKVTFHYIQASGIQEVARGKARPFLGVGMGVAIAAPGNAKYSTETRFAVSFCGGVKIMMSEKVGLRFQGRLMLPMYFSGGGVWFGTGGASVGVTAGIPMVQGDLGAGLVIVI